MSKYIHPSISQERSMHTHIVTTRPTYRRVLSTFFAIATTTGCSAQEGEETLDETSSSTGSSETETSGDALTIDDNADVLAVEQPDGLPLTATELSRLLLLDNVGVHNITNPYNPNGGVVSGHAGIDFGNTGNGVIDVLSPVNGTIKANTADCGKVAIFDGTNTIILAHMSNIVAPPVNSPITIGTALGKASNIAGGECVVQGGVAHLHIEIRTGLNTFMAIAANNNTLTTLNPLTYTYSPFPAVTLTAPAASANVVGSPVSFSWQPRQGANTYRLQISQTNAFTAETCTNGCVYNTAASSTSRQVALNPGTYYWRVRAGNSGQGGAWSVVRVFTRT